MPEVRIPLPDKVTSSRGFVLRWRGWSSGARSAWRHPRRLQTPMRQWVLTVPHGLRGKMAYDPGLTTVELRQLTAAVSAWLRSHILFHVDVLPTDKAGRQERIHETCSHLGAGARGVHDRRGASKPVRTPAGRRARTTKRRVNQWLANSWLLDDSPSVNDEAVRAWRPRLRRHL